ncbi:amino acid/amide ABC transporter substrate-binding protein (HAAT family) [Rhodobacter sp. JA431]|uniref:ABC transporter substrate-binding protein n=1 Tax=Rhodobacter sp. JA431 TaxID=570013 RepID=UPI000BD04C1A|nr:ABC transporter substrate-binding protein [Rhodobacter sp. JA431]SOC14662.1 amino acid/amide ABC transporter substrate-binding protein (HAAT family) [Rhodobacter sp. JA431]
MRLAATLALFALLAAPLGAQAQSQPSKGVTPGEVHFAQVAALEGPASALGTGMNLGIRAAFEEANRAGGVAGRQLKLDAFDDGYEPGKSVAQTRDVIAADAHIGFIGPVGTPTSAATQPLATEAGWPFIAPLTGAGFLRDPALRNVVNLRATYDAETEMWIKLLVDTQGHKKIGILYQDDGFGRVGLKGVEAALERRGMQAVARGAFPRNTLAVKTALLDIRRAGADAVVMVGPYKPVAEFIRVAHKIDYNPEFVTISFVGTDALVAELGAVGKDVVISQVVPFPSDTSVPVVARYNAALKALDPKAAPGFLSLEGYVAGRLAIVALEAAGKSLTRETYLTALQNLGEVDIDGLKLHFGPGDNQGFDDVFLTQISAEGTIAKMDLGAARAQDDCQPGAGG